MASAALDHSATYILFGSFFSEVVLGADKFDRHCVCEVVQGYHNAYHLFSHTLYLSLSTHRPDCGSLQQSLQDALVVRLNPASPRVGVGDKSNFTMIIFRSFPLNSS